jgi:hypothetical protein
LIGFQFKADIIARVEYHGGGKRHRHLPIAPIQIKVAPCSDIEIHTTRRIVIIAVPNLLRSSPMRWGPRRRAASRSLNNDRWRRTASDRYPNTDMGTAPVYCASRKHQGSESS